MKLITGKKKKTRQTRRLETWIKEIRRLDCDIFKYMYTHIKNISTILRRNNGQLNAVKGRKCNIYNSKLERRTNLASKELIDRYRRKKTKKKKPNCFILAWFGRTHETPFYSSSERIWCFKYKDTVWFAKKKKKYSKIFWFRSCV